MVCIIEKPKEETKSVDYKVAILTTYLTEGLQNFKCPAEFLEQVMLYGYDPNNLNGVEFIQTPKKKLISIYAPNHNPTDFDLVRQCDLAIYGSTNWAEDEVMQLKDSGVVIARYSIFYGNASGYSGRTPGDGGYSLDLPKAVGCATALITNDNVLESLVLREEARVRGAIADLNKGKEQAPILVTPFLKDALKIQRSFTK